MQIWKPIKGYEGLYEVSSLGDVKSLSRSWKTSTGHLITIKERLLKQHKMYKGYYQVILSKNNKSKTFRTHRLVAQAFIDNPNNKPEINHINGCKTDNRVSNLEWCTASENQKHSFKFLNKKTNSTKVLCLETNIIYKSITEAEKNTKINKSHICNVCKGKRNTAGGYIWRYVNE